MPEIGMQIALVQGLVLVQISLDQSHKILHLKSPIEF